jgi:hypothetical protein
VRVIRATHQLIDADKMAQANAQLALLKAHIDMASGPTCVWPSTIH